MEPWISAATWLLSTNNPLKYPAKEKTFGVAECTFLRVYACNKRLWIAGVVLFVGSVSWKGWEALHFTTRPISESLRLGGGYSFFYLLLLNWVETERKDRKGKPVETRWALFDLHMLPLLPPLRQTSNSWLCRSIMEVWLCEYISPLPHQDALRMSSLFERISGDFFSLPALGEITSHCWGSFPANQWRDSGGKGQIGAAAVAAVVGGTEPQGKAANTDFNYKATISHVNKAADSNGM